MFSDLTNSQKDSSVIRILKKSGKLENEDVLEPLLYLVNSNNSTIRTLSIKNLAKFQKISLLDLFIKPRV